MIQGGCPDGNGMGGPGYEINGEFSGNGFKQNDLKHDTGVLSMARTMAPNSAGSQFFVMVAPAPHLDGQYAAFGQVTEGSDIAIDISRVPRNMMNDKPKKDQVIQSIRVDTQGVEYPEPETH
jgi:peptidyl-prolyl cis-trans isomerase B (cyclophilin B)